MRDQDTSEQDVRKVIFNAVERMISDKAETSGLGDRMQALAKFETTLRAKVMARAGTDEALDAIWEAMLQEAIEAIRFDERQKAYVADKGMPDERRDFRRSMLNTPEGQHAMVVNPVFASTIIESLAQHDRDAWLDPAWVGKRRNIASIQALHGSASISAQARSPIDERMLDHADGHRALATNPVFGGAVLANCDMDKLKGLDLQHMFGAGKAPVAAEALLTLASRNGRVPFDDDLFAKLTDEIDPDTWNDKTPYTRGFGTRVCHALWNGGQYDKVAALVEHGVDTSLAARASGEIARGVFSDFVQPIQHVASKLLRDIDATDKARAVNQPDCDRLRMALIPRINDLSDALPH